MTEQEYIDIKHFTILSCAIDTLRDFVPEMSSVVTKDEYYQMKTLLCNIHQKHSIAVKITDPNPHKQRPNDVRNS